MEPISSGRRHRAMRTFIVALFTIFVAGCSAITGSAGPTPVTGITIGAEAAAAVAARSPLFDGIGQQDPNVIGASAWWTATPSDAGSPPTAWTVVFQIGSGDCQAGCIDNHTWTWLVDNGGAVTLQSEIGAPLPDAFVAQQVAQAAGPGVGGRVTAGPVCPVEQPGDPNCAPRPVAGAGLTVMSGDKQVATFTTDLSGLYRIALPAGDYVLVASSVEGLMGTPAPLLFTVSGTQLTPLDVPYDTGIR